MRLTILPKHDYKRNQYGIHDLLGVTLLSAVAICLVPIATHPAMYFLWLPIGLTVVFSTGLVVAGRRGAKRALLATTMALIALFLTGAALYMLAWIAYVVYAIVFHVTR